MVRLSATILLAVAVIAPAGIARPAVAADLDYSYAPPPPPRYERPFVVERPVVVGRRVLVERPYPYYRRWAYPRPFYRRPYYARPYPAYGRPGVYAEGPPPPPPYAYRPY